MGLIDKKHTNQALVGVIRAVPIIFGYLPVSLAFGVLASTAGLTIYSATAMSLFVYAGSAQLISVGLISGGASAAAITVTVFLINVRHMLFSAHLAPYLGNLKRWQQVIFSYELTDESFAIHSLNFRKQGVPPITQLFALNISAHLTWIGGTVIGAWVGGRLSFDTAAYGIDYVLPAMFIALLVMQIENNRRAVIAVLAAILGLGLYLAGMSQLYIIVAAVIAASVGTALEKESAGEDRDTEGGGTTNA